MNRFYTDSLAELAQADEGIMKLPERLGTEGKAQNRHDRFLFPLLRDI
jgi:hypothetical protein